MKASSGVFGQVTVAKDDRLPLPVAVVRIFDTEGTPLEVLAGAGDDAAREGGHPKK